MIPHERPTCYSLHPLNSEQEEEKKTTKKRHDWCLLDSNAIQSHKFSFILWVIGVDMTEGWKLKDYQCHSTLCWGCKNWTGTNQRRCLPTCIRRRWTRCSHFILRGFDVQWRFDEWTPSAAVKRLFFRGGTPLEYLRWCGHDRAQICHHSKQQSKRCSSLIFCLGCVSQFVMVYLPSVPTYGTVVVVVWSYEKPGLLVDRLVLEVKIDIDVLPFSRQFWSWNENSRSRPEWRPQLASIGQGPPSWRRQLPA